MKGHAMSVTLAKSSDNAVSTHPYAARTWQNTVTLSVALSTLFGREGDHLYEGLADNDLTSLGRTLTYWHRYDNTTGKITRRGYVNYPTLLKRQASVTEHVRTTDYSDGYGSTYSRGE